MADDQGVVPVKAGLGRWRWVLAVSLALNLLVLGVLAGGFLLRADGPPGRSFRFDLSIFPYTEALTPADRAALLREWRTRGPGPGEILAERRAENQAVLAALRADPFDPQALGVAMAARMERGQAHSALGQALLVERLNALTPAERAAYAGRLEEALSRGPRASRDAPRSRPEPRR